jgi:uncharacterized secreted protein with C-terminal beta-propeller domain
VTSFPDLGNENEFLNSKLQEIDCQKVVRPLFTENNWTMTKILSLRLDQEPAIADSLATLGMGGMIYMSKDFLYLVKNPTSVCYDNCAELYEGVGDTDSVYEQIRNSSSIVQVNLNSETSALSAVGLGMVKGEVKDSWALQEFEQDDEVYLAVASTERDFSLSSSEVTNHLTILKNKDKELKEYGGIKNFGDREDIRSVRYVGRMAYVVTFEKTDPLWSISLEDFKNPVILGHLEVPGFSTYLHPVGLDSMIGVGLDATDQGDFALLQGIQLSFFDLTKPDQVLRKDNLVFGGRGSYSHASSDRNAFYFDSEKNILALPMVEFNDVENGSWEMGEKRIFSGARVFWVDRAEGIFFLSESISHFEMMPRQCNWKVYPRWGWWQDEASFDIQRIVKVDGKIITLSPFGEKVWNMSSAGRMTLQKSVVFSDPSDLCSF